MTAKRRELNPASHANAKTANTIKLWNPAVLLRGLFPLVELLEAAMMLNEEKDAWTNHIAAFLGFSLSQVNWSSWMWHSKMQVNSTVNISHQTLIATGYTSELCQVKNPKNNFFFAIVLFFYTLPTTHTLDSNHIDEYCLLTELLAELKILWSK